MRWKANNDRIKEEYRQCVVDLVREVYDGYGECETREDKLMVDNTRAGGLVECMDNQEYHQILLDGDWVEKFRADIDERFDQCV